MLGWALYAYLASSGIAAALGVAGFFVKPRLQKKRSCDTGCGRDS